MQENKQKCSVLILCVYYTLVYYTVTSCCEVSQRVNLQCMGGAPLLGMQQQTPNLSPLNADMMNIQAAVCSLVLYSCLFTENKPLHQTCKQPKLKAQWGTLSPSLQGLTDNVILITCNMSIKCTKFKWCLPGQSDSFPLRTIRRFTQVFSLLHTLPQHLLVMFSLSCSVLHRVGRGTTQVAEWEKLISSVSQLLVLETGL